MWTLLKWSRLEPTASLFWLLNGWPSNPRTPAGCSGQQRTWSLTLFMFSWDNQAEAHRGCLQVQDFTTQTDTVSALLVLKSQRHSRDILNSWTNRLTCEELEMLQDYAREAVSPDEGDPWVWTQTRLDWLDHYCSSQLQTCVFWMETLCTGSVWTRGNWVGERLKVQYDCKPV